MRIISHAPSRERQIAEMFTRHCSMVDPPRTEFASCYPSGSKHLEVACRFLENLLTPGQCISLLVNSETP
jgi:hypothetical protein